ncbi:MAG: hypothetical protein E7295_11780 [Lachnospiraceae bacterium]|nr:hypothetical protein [Lachnospiraceae bacterium]
MNKSSRERENASKPLSLFPSSMGGSLVNTANPLSNHAVMDISMLAHGVYVLAYGVYVLAYGV